MTDARQTAAKLAAQINEIVSARGSNYGAPEDNFANIANFWNAWIHARYKCPIALDPVDVGIMSSLIKVARLAQTPGHEDSALDGAIYMLLGYGCGVSDREPGMTDFSFEADLPPAGSSLPAMPDDGCIWFPCCGIKDKPHDNTWIKVQLHDGSTKSRHVDMLNWSAELERPECVIIRWRPLVQGDDVL